MAKSDRLTVKQENFAQHLATHGNMSDAYRYAYKTKNMTSKTVNEAASRLANDYKIRTRIEELQEEAWIGQLMTMERVIGMHTKVYVEAMRTGQLAAANTAAQSISKLKGHIKEKSEVKIEQTVDVTHKQEEVRDKVMDILSSIETERSSNEINDDTVH